MKHLYTSLLLLAAIFCSKPVLGQSPTPVTDAYRKLCVAFYNVENLFDTIDDPGVIDEEFTPTGMSKWDSKRYYHKLDHLSEVLGQIGGRGPAVVGLAEVENRRCLQDLINTPSLRNNHYGICHFDSPEARGVDVAFLYRTDVLEVEEEFPHTTVIPEQPGFRTRYLLRLSGYIEGAHFHFIVGHWPSRSGGQKVSEHKRMGAAATMRRIVDSLIGADPACNVILMGDFNDDPIDKSMLVGLKAHKKPRNLKSDDLFNPMYKMYKDGMGTLAYRDTWNLFDNMIINGNLLGDNAKQWRVLPDAKTGNYAYIFKRPWMTTRDGRYKGYPWRTIVGGQYQGGYSDHLPVYLYIVKGEALP